MALTGNELRKSFIEFFESKGHKHVRSSSLVPHNDPTILFTNAGMNQFKDYFLGNQVPEFKRAVTSQKVMRAGGKHNDLENVGRTDRHHTFFEMLGNFSFGDYFKKEAIEYAWEYLTVVLNIPEDALVVSVFEDDQEAFDIWNKIIGIPAEKIGQLGEKENFWSMGDVGPCGPCSEIHFQLNPLPEGKSVQQALEDDDGTYLEVWNLVFMQYNQEQDGGRVALPNPSIDTGMGIERIASVIQKFKSNYESDLLSGLVKHVKENAPNPKGDEAEIEVSARVIADHIRASVFLISDGVIPSNEGRGYVMRRIIRRAARHGKELGYHPGFYSELVDVFVPMMSDAYPEIEENKDYIKILLEQEEKRFSATLNHGMKILDELLETYKNKDTNLVDGSEIFKLYDTYGFPADLADDILQDHGLTYDKTQFEQSMEEQRQRAKADQGTKKIDLKVNQVYLDLLSEGLGNRFIGYQTLEVETSIKAVLKDGARVDQLSVDDQVEVLLSETPFYAESGGQVGDKGEISCDEFRMVVKDTQSPVAGLIFVSGEITSTTVDSVKIGSNKSVLATVSKAKRLATEVNHTATHLLQAALRTVLGDHVKQAGSLVNSEKLRFDFSHYAPVTTSQITDIETIINQRVRDNESVFAEEMEFDKAVKSGAMAIFGEKYGDHVRVVTSGSSSKELCGGCHTGKTGNIGLLKIVSEESIAAGIRRIEAITGSIAIKYIQENLGILEGISQKLKVPLSEVGNRVEQVISQVKEKEKQIEHLRKEIQETAAEKSLNNVEKISEMNVLIMQTGPDIDLKSHSGILLKSLKSGVVLLSNNPEPDKISVVLSVSRDLVARINAGSIIKELSPLIEARGGGSPNMAQCGGSKPSGWEQLTEDFKKMLVA
ncbi:alanine--tRNA ligase [bacterium]|nr:alanine--tRNA ligase [bacterium]